MIDLTQPTGAVFSDDRKYRYALWRRWNSKLPILMCIGLNPSTANESTNDKTISNLIEIARRHNYGTLIMCNLFSFVSTDPTKLPDDAVIDGDDDWLDSIAQMSDGIAYVWGNFKGFDQRIQVVRSIIGMKTFHPLCLGKNKNGSPKHPCRLSYSTKLVPFR